MAKLGSKERPAVVHVENIERAGEIMALCDKNKWRVIVGIEPDKPEDLSDIERLANPPKPITKTIDVGRNEPCPCGSGKKYKHCCMNKDI